MKLTGHDPELGKQRLEDHRLEMLITKSIQLQEMKRIESECWMFRMLALLSFYIAQHVAIHIGPEWTTLDMAIVACLGFLSCKSFLDAQDAWREFLEIAEVGK